MVPIGDVLNLSCPKSTSESLAETPFYLSIVATTRNDNHGGDLLKRTKAFLKSVYVQAKKFSFPVELIIVEWNPPADRPLLKEVLPNPDESTPVRLKYVVVPNELHQTYRFADALALYQMIAKNVGIRRAEGEFVLCTNIDILFTDECFETIVQRNLMRGKFYRANRCDVPKEVLDVDAHAEQLKFAQSNILRRLGKSPGYEALDLPSVVYNFPRLTRIANKLLLTIWKWTHENEFPHFVIDFMACGDFTLMSKEDWLLIDGYVELDMYSIHIDSMGLWSACALGMEQVIFPYKACVYHIDHENGWESDDVIKTIKFLSDKPCLDYSIVHRAGMKMVANGTNWGLNTENWGWADKEFEEFIFDGNISE
jgi:hypothetical protein